MSCTCGFIHVQGTHGGWWLEKGGYNPPKGMTSYGRSATTRLAHFASAVLGRCLRKQHYCILHAHEAGRERRFKIFYKEMKFVTS
jgi:hypothetical protein